MPPLHYIDHLPQPAVANFKALGIKVLRPTQLLTMTLQDSDNLVVLCELNRDKEDNTVKRTDLHGIHLVQELRRKKFKGKVLFVSFLTRRYIAQNKLKHSIINAIGHGFSRLPTHPQNWFEEFKTIKILDEVEWYDIDTNYCNKAGLAQQELHALNGILNDASFDAAYVKTQIHNCLLKIGALYSVNCAEYEKTLDYTDLAQAIRAVSSYCNQIIRDSIFETATAYSSTPKQPWSILLLDDEITADHQLVKDLEAQVERVFCVQTAAAAETILANNSEKGYKIALVLSDYRLFETAKTDSQVQIHQPKQGYKFLMETAAEYSYLALAALSALPRKFLLQSFKRMGIRVDIYSKKDYFESDATRKILVDELVEKGREGFENISRLPRQVTEVWAYYEPFYAYHRSQPDYHANERYIATRSEAYCHSYPNPYFDLTGYTTELKSKTKTPAKPKVFQEFLEKMVCRRAVLWYSQTRKIDSLVELFKFLKGRNYKEVDDSGKQKEENTAKNQINRCLGLQLTNFPWTATIEERDWLTRMGLEGIEKLEAREAKFLNLAEAVFKELNFDNLPSPNTFPKCRLWLKTGRNQLPKTIEPLLKTTKKLLGELKIIYPNLHAKQPTEPKAPLNFYYYLLRLKGQIIRLQNAVQAGTLPTDLESLKQKIIQKARTEFSKNYELAEGMEASAILFFEELKTKGEKYANFNAYYKAFKTYHKQELGYYDSFKTVNRDEQYWASVRTEEEFEDDL